jgi:4-diphosphocytidyl-2-C-methyl-D-erythritol kinase
MLVFPNAKINLGLEVLGRRPDGFHDIDTVMVPVGVRDALEFVPCAGPEDVWHMSGLPIPAGGAANTVSRALELVRETVQVPPLHIYLHKAIPMGAGMGGGSADGAFMLQALYASFGKSPPVEVLEAQAARIGSDCPFFVRNVAARATGRGEVLEPVALNLSGYHVLLVYPGVHISTAQAYAAMRPEAAVVSPEEVVCTRPIHDWRYLLRNRFEEYAFGAFRQIEELRDRLYAGGALYAAMTGSGSAVYGIFDAMDKRLAGELAGGFSWDICTW